MGKVKTTKGKKKPTQSKIKGLTKKVLDAIEKEAIAKDKEFALIYDHQLHEWITGWQDEFGVFEMIDICTGGPVEAIIEAYESLAGIKRYNENGEKV